MKKIRQQQIDKYVDFLKHILENYKENFPLTISQVTKMCNVSSTAITVMHKLDFLGKNNIPKYKDAEPWIARALIIGIRQYGKGEEISPIKKPITEDLLKKITTTCKSTFSAEKFMNQNQYNVIKCINNNPGIGYYELAEKLGAKHLGSFIGRLNGMVNAKLIEEKKNDKRGLTRTYTLNPNLNIMWLDEKIPQIRFLQTDDNGRIIENSLEECRVNYKDRHNEKEFNKIEADNMRLVKENLKLQNKTDENHRKLSLALGYTKSNGTYPDFDFLISDCKREIEALIKYRTAKGELRKILELRGNCSIQDIVDEVYSIVSTLQKSIAEGNILRVICEYYTDFSKEDLDMDYESDDYTPNKVLRFIKNIPETKSILRHKQMLKDGILETEIHWRDFSEIHIKIEDLTL